VLPAFDAIRTLCSALSRHAIPEAVAIDGRVVVVHARRTMSDAPTPMTAKGLTSAEAAALLDEHGLNEPAAQKTMSTAVEVGVLLGNPLVIILIVATIITAIVGEFVNAIIIGTMVVASIIIDFTQTYRSHRAAERLREQVAPTATVMRDGQFVELPRKLLVPGDLVRLSAGDLVPADGRLVQSRDLHVQESVLTGESLPAEKEVGAPDAASEVFLGTSVVSGTALARVETTGPATRFGDVAARLAARVPPTEFEHGVRQFGLLIMKTVFVLVLFILAVSLAMRRNPLESMLFAVALAVGLTPEFLPMITTVTLAKGAVRMSRAHVIVKHLASIQNFGSIDILCSDKTGTLTTGEMELVSALDLAGAESPPTRTLGWVNAALETGIRSPLDAAILRGVSGVATEWTKLDEVPFDFERRRVSVVVLRQGTRTLVTKGAPESVLAVSTHYRLGDASTPFDEQARARLTKELRAMGEQGLRVLAVASRVVEDKPAYRADEERELTLEGLMAFSDPPLADASDTLASLARDGLTVKILTGDNEHVARHVCAQVGLDVSDIVLGTELEAMNDTALGAVAERTTVFARVTPAQKNRIILALKIRGHVVGFLGDGINYAPSLHAADVGISVSTAVDVARDAADVILLKPGLRVLHQGILEGRAAFGNVTKYLLMGTSSNFGNMFSMAGAALFLPFLPMLPMQILLNNLLYDIAQLTIPTDHVDDEYVRSPQRWNIRGIRNFMLLIGPISSLYDFLTFFVLLRVFHATPEQFHTGWFVESLATQTLVIFVIRTMQRPWRSRPSWPLVATSLSVVAASVLLPFSPLAHWLGFVPLPLGFLVFVLTVVLTYLALVETVKATFARRLGLR
jgi:P-type Mg2+ transporter